MARPVRPEVQYADREARRYFRAQWREGDKLGFSATAPGFDIIIKATGHTPVTEDETLDKVGTFVNLLPPEDLRVVKAHYRDSRPAKVKAYELDMTEHQFKYKRGMFLTLLAGFLLGPTLR